MLVQKYLFLIIIYSISFSSYSFQCNDQNLTEDVSNISDLLTELTDDACNETSNDVDLLNLMKCVPKAIDTYESTKKVLKECEGVSNPAAKALFLPRLVGPKYPGSRDSSRSKEKSSLVDFMLMDGKASNSSKEKIISEFQRNVLQFSEKVSCRPHNIVIERKFTPSLILKSFKIGDIDEINKKRIRTDADLRKALSSYTKTAEFKERHERMKERVSRKYGQTIWSDKIVQSNCSDYVKKDHPRNYTRAKLPAPSCYGRVEINFANDSSTVTSKNFA